MKHDLDLLKKKLYELPEWDLSSALSKEKVKVIIDAGKPIIMILSAELLREKLGKVL